MADAGDGARPAPVAQGERIAALDALRGFALLGVFLANITGLGGVEVMATAAQLEALPSARLDQAAHFLGQWLVHDKANTLFAFLFGVGFWVQMQRMEGRGGGFEAIYLRRVLILLGIGALHLVALFPWDILHLYAIAGLVLLALRGLSDRALIIGGLALAVFGRLVVGEGFEVAGVAGPAFDRAYSDEAVLARQAASASGDYLVWMGSMARLYLADWFASGLVAGWFVYVLGRFMVGAWVARRGWLQRTEALAPQFRAWMARLLPLGLAGEFVAALIEAGLDAGRLAPEGAWRIAGEALHLAAAPTLAAGYACAIVSALNAPRLRGLVAPLGAVGRMALTNYVGQSVIIFLVLFQIGPGLGLAGDIGAAGLVGVALLGFAGQVLISRLWLANFAYGPLEWVWRALTYGRAPRLRRAV